LTIDSGQIREAISEPLNAISGAVLTILERTPPELASDLLDKGIMLAGGGASLKNMDSFLRSVIKLPVNIAEDPLTAVAVGAGKALENLEILKGLEKR
jgi:rod shape-determining protein MreB